MHAELPIDRLDAPRLDPEEERRRLERGWTARGAMRWFAVVDHKAIGIRYLVTAFLFFALAGVTALAMRLQLWKPENGLVGPDLYNQMFTVHGSTMMFLFAVPVMGGLGIYLVPMMVGTRNVAFPRLNSFGYFTYLGGGLMLWIGFLLNVGPDAGWFAYTPLSSTFSPGHRVDVWADMITLTEFSALVVAVEIITTTFKQRAPGMTLERIPLFVWSMVVQSFMVIFAMPAVMLASGYLALDRLVGTHIFNYAEGGDSLLYQHMFWFFGHPEVYIIFVPALGIMSHLITTFTRRPVFGYPALVASVVATGFVSFGLWVHHMFATGLPQLGESFFTAASMIISIPTGVQIFCWLATIWTGRLVLRAPMYWVFGFFVTFVIGGLTGVMTASVPLDLQVHDSFFVVAHLHYVLIGGAVFPLLGGILFWFPKMTGRMMDERLGKLSFWLVLIGFHATFFPMHVLGLQGMPRRVYTYLPDRGWTSLNQVATVGAMVLGLGVLLFVLNVALSWRGGAIAGADPWAADTLEWSLPSPPPVYNFLHIPVVTGRAPLWEEDALTIFVSGLDPDHPEVLITNLFDAEPELRAPIAGPNYWPFWTGVATTLTMVFVMFNPWPFVAGTVIAGATILGWHMGAGDEQEEGGEETSNTTARGERPAEATR